MVESVRKLIDCGYFSLKVTGKDLIPKTSRPVVFIGNHSGWMALDAIIWFLATDIPSDEPNKIPYAVIEDALLDLPFMKGVLDQFAIRKSQLKRGKLPENAKKICIFPEGSDGNCKSFLQAYHMQPWKPGFVKLALHHKAIVAPSLIIGGEEALPSLMPIRLTRPFIGSSIPWPIFPMPLPTKWEVHFLKPIDFRRYPKNWQNSKSYIHGLIQEIQEQHQAELDAVTRKRPLRRWADKLEWLF